MHVNAECAVSVVWHRLTQMSVNCLFNDTMGITID